MRYAAWDADLSMPDENGNTQRATLAIRARQGATWAIKRLKGPWFPEELRYLWVWVHELRRGLGFDMNGLAQLTWTGVQAWARLTGRRPKPYEVEALFQLDAAIRHPAPVLALYMDEDDD